MKKTLAIILALIMVFSTVGCAAKTEAPAPAAEAVEAATKWNPDGEFYMITFQSGLEFWQECYLGFEEAASVYGVKTYYTGSETNDISEQVTILEQVANKNPAGICMTTADSEGLVDAINAVMAKGIPVVLFDNDASKSDRYSIIAANNYSAGEYAAKTMAEILGGKGEVAVIYGVGITSSTDRANGFIDYIDANCPDMKVVTTGNSVGDETEAAQVASGIIQGNPNLAGIYATNSPRTVGAATAVREAGKVGEIQIIGFDTDESVLDLIDAGEVYGTVKQGAYNMGYWSFEFLFHVANNFVNPVDNWKENGVAPLPISVDAGTTIINKDNLALFR